ncbi:MAG: oligosaccharide flippase family protein [Pseudomonadota bacterium]
MGATGISGALYLALIFFLTSHLSATQYGVVGVYQSTVAFFLTLVGLNTAGAAARSYFDGEEGRARLPRLAAASIHVSLLTALGLVLIVGAVGQLLAKTLSVGEEVLLAAVLASTAASLITLYQSLAQARKQAFAYGTAQTARSALDLAFSAGLILMLAATAENRIFGHLAALFVVASYGIYRLLTERLLNFTRVYGNHFREILRYGVPLTPHALGKFCLAAADKLVVAGLLGLEQAGVYLFASQLAQLIELGFGSLNNAIVPWLYQLLSDDEATQTRRLLVRSSLAAFLSIAAFSAVLIFLVFRYLESLVPAEYSGVAAILMWLIVGQAAGGYYLLVTNYLFYTRRTGTLSALTLLAGIVNLIFLFPLVNHFGVTGAAMAFAGTMVLRFLLTFAAAQRVYPLPWLLTLGEFFVPRSGRDSNG